LSALTIPLPVLERMIHARRLEVRRLERLRAMYQRKVDSVDRRIAALSGNGGGRAGGRRRRNETNLSDAIAAVLSRAPSPLGVGDIVERVRAAGYRSSSANFRGMVNIALVKDRRFVREGRGVYRLRGTGHANGKARAPKQRRKTTVENPTAESNGSQTPS
jgi:hypothetical protein